MFQSVWLTYLAMCVVREFADMMSDDSCTLYPLAAYESDNHMYSYADYYVSCIDGLGTAGNTYKEMIAMFKSRSFNWITNDRNRMEIFYCNASTQKNKE